MPTSLYTTLKKIENVSDSEAQTVADKVAYKDDTATKIDIEKLIADNKIDIEKLIADNKIDIEKLIAENKVDLANLGTRLIRQMYAVAGIVIAAVSLIVKVF